MTGMNIKCFQYYLIHIKFNYITHIHLIKSGFYPPQECQMEAIEDSSQGSYYCLEMTIHS